MDHAPERRIRPTALLALLLATATAHAAGFDITPLGTHGGLTDGNLSAYLIRDHNSPNAILCDAGTILPGLEIATRDGAFNDIPQPATSTLTKPGYILTHAIKAYLISHAHMDHIAGLVAISPDDTLKPIYALPETNAALQQNIFNWQIWPNLTDQGAQPRLNRYTYQNLPPETATPIPQTGLSVTAYPLSHGNVLSTAFLIQNGPDAYLYLGDTGPDPIEHSKNLTTLWQAITPILRSGHLLGLSIECSYDDSRPDKQLYGHLSPHWLLQTLNTLDTLSDQHALAKTPILITHIKPTLTTGTQPETRIAQQIEALNTHHFHFIIARQGITLHLSPPLH